MLEYGYGHRLGDPSTGIAPQARSWNGPAPAGVLQPSGGILVQTGRDLVKAGMVRLLLSPLGSNRWWPEWGNPAFRFLHREVADQATATLVAYESGKALARWIDRIKVVMDSPVHAYQGAYSYQDGVVTIQITFYWRDTFSEDRVIVDLPLE